MTTHYKAGVWTDVHYVASDGTVRWTGPHPRLRDILDIAERIWNEEAQRDLTITELFGGRHTANSFHYIGMAADLRTNDLKPETLVAVKAKLVAALQPFNYTVIDEGSHLHLEPADAQSLYPAYLGATNV